MFLRKDFQADIEVFIHLAMQMLTTATDYVRVKSFGVMQQFFLEATLQNSAQRLI